MNLAKHIISRLNKLEQYYKYIMSNGGGGGVSAWGDITGTLSNQGDLWSALGGKENAFNKNTAFNKNFGTSSGTVAQGNHTHTFASITSKPTTIAGYGITNALKNTTDTLTGDLTVTGNIDLPSNGQLIFNGGPTQYIKGWSGRISFGSLTTEWARFQSGNFGIDTTSPSEKLSVNGNANISGNVTAANFILSSDERLKTNIKEISETEKIDVDWKTFSMKDGDGEKRYGVIAQELECKHPEFVRTDVNGIKSVAYIDLLVAKMAQQDNEIAELKAMVKQLMNK